MKQAFIIGLIIFLAFPSDANAQGVTMTPSMTPAATRQLQLLETRKESSPSTGLVNSDIATTLEILVIRMEAAVVRVEKISQRIGTRMEKLQKARLPISRLTTRYRTLTRSLEALKSELTKVQEYSVQLQTEGFESNEYPRFRTQYLKTYELLTDILIEIKSLVSDLKQFPLPTVKPTVTPKVTPQSNGEE